MVTIGIKRIMQVSGLCNYKNIRYHYCSLFGQRSRWQNWVGHLCNITNKFQPVNLPLHFLPKIHCACAKEMRKYAHLCALSNVWNSLLLPLPICSV